MQITSNDKGIAHVVNDLSNPPDCDPKAGSLLGCATPRHCQSVDTDQEFLHMLSTEHSEFSPFRMSRMCVKALAR